jgi:acetolactate synthase I/III small subunit
MKHTLVATMEDGPAVLNRVVSLFRQRGFAIDSLTIGKTHEPHVMRLTMVVDGSKTAVEQVVKQLYKVIEVRKVSDLTLDTKIERELALIKVFSRNSSMRAEIMQVADIYRGRVVDVSQTSLTIEVTGPTDKIDSLIQLLRPYGIKELVRTGVVAMSRGMAGVAKEPAPVDGRATTTAAREPANLKAIASA